MQETVPRMTGAATMGFPREGLTYLRTMRVLSLRTTPLREPPVPR